MCAYRDLDIEKAIRSASKNAGIECRTIASRLSGTGRLGAITFEDEFRVMFYHHLRAGMNIPYDWIGVQDTYNCDSDKHPRKRKKVRLDVVIREGGNWGAKTKSMEFQIQIVQIGKKNQNGRDRKST